MTWWERNKGWVNRAIDIAIVVVILAALLVDAEYGEHGAGVSVLGTLTALGATIPLLWRRRAPIVSEAEFLARRESVDRVMVIRQRDDLTQIGVLEDKVLVEHYVARESQTSLIGNVYLGRVQNVLPSMEAAFIDIGRGRNAVLYAGQVNWVALVHKEGQPRKVESVLSSGQAVLVQVT